MGSRKLLITTLFILLVLLGVLYLVKIRPYTNPADNPSSRSVSDEVVELGSKLRIENNDPRFIIDIASNEQAGIWLSDLQLLAPDGGLIADGRPVAAETFSGITIRYTTTPQQLPVKIGSSQARSSYNILPGSGGVPIIIFQFDDSVVASDGFNQLINIELIRVLTKMSISRRGELFDIVNNAIPVIRDQPARHILKKITTT